MPHSRTPIRTLLTITLLLHLALISFIPTSAHSPTHPIAQLPNYPITNYQSPISNLQSLSTTYTITDLGPWLPYAINDQRQIVGGHLGSAVVWQDGQLYDLGKFGQLSARFVDVNENHQFVGYAENADTFLSFRWTDTNTNQQVDNGEVAWLGDLGGGKTTASAINDSGKVVGTSWNSDDEERAFLWDAGGMTDLGGNYAQAFDINDNGTVVGEACLDPDPCDEHTDPRRAVRWASSGGPPTPLITADNAVRASEINNHGEIIGQYTFFDGFPTDAFLWLPEPAHGQPPGLQILDFSLFAPPYGGINNHGAVVGNEGSYLAQNSFLWEAGVSTDLNTLLPANSGWVLNFPTSINDFGDIVGMGYLNGVQHGFLLSPPAKWTIMHYMAADNDLGNSYPAIFNHLETLANTPGVNLLVFWDNRPGGDSGYYKVQYDTDPNSYAEYTADENFWPQGELDTGSPLTLSDFLIWGIQNYPAEHYALTLDDHGSGLGGGLCDDNGGPGCASKMSLAEMKLALATAHDLTGEKLDVLYMAMCLMGMLEDAYQFRDYTDFYVASENIQFTYSNYLTDLDGNLTPVELATLFASNYAGEMTSRNKAYTISVVNIAQLAPLVEAVDQLAVALLNEIQAIAPALFNLGIAVQRYDNRAPDGITPDDTYADLYDLASQIHQTFSSHPNIATAAQGVMTAVDTAVIYEAHASTPTTNLGNSHGLSIFFPSNPSSFYYGDNNDFATGTNWGNPLHGPTGDSIAWGPFVVAYIAETNPTGPEDATPPEPIAKAIDFISIFLPVIIR